MRLGTVLKAAAALAAVLAVALVAVVKSIDVDAYGRQVAEAVAAETGRELKIGGRFDLQLSLTPRLVATDVRLANLPGGSRDDMLTVQRLDVEIGLLPLLRREVRIERLVMVKPDLLLENGNWELSPVAPEAYPPVEGPSTKVVVGKVRMDGATVAVRTANGVRSLQFERLTLDAEGGAGPLSLNGRGMLDGRKLDLSGVFGSLAELRGQTKPFPVKMRAALGGVVAVAEGTVADVDGMEGLDLKLSLEATEAAELASLGGATVPEMGPLRIAGKLVGAAAAPELTEIEAALGRKETMRLTAKGAIKAPLALDGVDLALTGDAANVGKLLARTGAAAQEGPPLALTAHLTRKGGPWSLANLKAKAGQNDLVGAATLTLDGARPNLAASLASKRLDLAELGLAQPAPAEGAPAGDGKLFSEAPFALEGLRWLDADLSWKGETLVLRGLALENADLRLHLEKGVLRIKPATANLAAGTISAEAVLDARKAPATMRASLSADKVDLGQVLASAGLTRSLSGGSGDLRVALSGKGDSMHQLMRSLDGETSLVVGQARIAAGRVDLLAFDVMRQLAPWVPGEAGTDLNCFVARFAVDEGVATAQQFLVDTSQLTMGGEGSVDLGAETVQATLVPRAKQASLMNLATPMDVSGPLTAPSVGPNKLALAKGVAVGAIGAVVAPPLAILPFVTAGTGDENPCVEALKQAKQPAGKAAPKAKAKQGLALPDVGGAITDLFGKTR